jgi:hypothetical protein
MKYHIHAYDGGIGHVQGFLVEERTWAIRYMIVDTSNWWLDHLVLVSPRWISAVEWTGFKVFVDLTRDAVKHAPPYHSGSQLDRDQEIGLHRHYVRPGYWAGDTRENSTGPGP